MGKCFLHGNGGSSLNFKVVGGTTQPSNPVRNMLWANTATPITGYIFSATEPTDLNDGMLWIATGTSSGAAFNALKKDCLMVYPLSAKQRISGALANVVVKVYQDGWKDLLTEVVFFGDGAINTEVFGEIQVASGHNSNTFYGGNIGFGSYVDISASKLFDVSAFNTVECVIGVWNYLHVNMYLVDSSGKAYKLSTITSDQVAGGLLTFDVSDYSGEYYVRFATDATSNSVTYSSIKFKV